MNRLDKILFPVGVTVALNVVTLAAVFGLTLTASEGLVLGISLVVTCALAVVDYRLVEHMDPPPEIERLTPEKVKEELTSEAWNYSKGGWIEVNPVGTYRPPWVVRKNPFASGWIAIKHDVIPQISFHDTWEAAIDKATREE